MKNTLANFEKDLIEFIKNHEYTKEFADDGIDLPECDEDEKIIEIITTDGEYESIQIKLTYIA